MTEQKATNVVWHEHKVTLNDREKLKGHKGAVLWFTGLSASGKSTLASEVEGLLYKRECHTYILDGDNVRHGLNKDLGFSPEDRHENIRRIGELSHLFADAGLLAMTAFISPYESDRSEAREMNPDNIFVEIFCDCPLVVCESRDPKGLYKKARAGEIKQFTGIDAPYEIPADAELVVQTGSKSVEECAEEVVDYLEKNGILLPVT